MNPFQLSRPARNTRPLDESRSSIRMMRLHADLTELAADLDTDGWASIAIVQTPDRLQVSSQDPTEAITPLLAAALLADLERVIVAAEHVRAKMPSDWQDKLIG